MPHSAVLNRATIAFASLGVTGGSYVIVERLGAVTASSATHIPPVVALMIGWWLVGEPIRVSDVAAIALILMGVVLL